MNKSVSVSASNTDMHGKIVPVMTSAYCACICVQGGKKNLIAQLAVLKAA